MTPYYESSGIRIYHGDSAEILPALGIRFDLCLTDPPYGIGEAAGKNKSRGKLAVAKDFGNLDWDDATPSALLLEACIGSSSNSIIWGGNYFGLPASSQWLVWDKDNGASDFADCELAWTNLGGAVRRLRCRWAGMLQERMGADKEHRVHPTQKPLALMKWCLGLCDSAEHIVDPFMGPGTTLVAAQQLGLRAVGIERAEEYCEAAAKRLDQKVLPLFAPEPKLTQPELIP